MSTFTLDNATVQSIATLHHATPVSKSDRETTPILTAVQLTVTPSTWSAIATDRYVVAQLTGDMGDHVHTLTEEPFTVQIASTDLVDLAKRVKTSRAPVLFTVSDDSTEIECNDYSTRVTYRTVSGNYPTVARLFPDNPPETVDNFAGYNLNPHKIMQIAKVQPTNMNARDMKNAPLLMRTVDSERGSKSPVLITRPRVNGFRALIQPNLILP